MCIKLVERYADCHCPYYEHSVDPCAKYGRRGHDVSVRIIHVGYRCERHSKSRSKSSHKSTYSDSGYGSYSTSQYSSGDYNSGHFR